MDEITTEDLARVHRRIDSSDVNKCWIWPGYKHKHGYGMINISRHRKGPIGVHRLMYEGMIAKVPSGLVLDHLCRVPSCCNPFHLEPVTLTENFRRGKKPYRTPPTECKRGHTFEPGSYRFSTGRRKCLACESALAFVAYWRNPEKYRERSRENDRKKRENA